LTKKSNEVLINDTMISPELPDRFNPLVEEWSQSVLESREEQRQKEDAIGLLETNMLDENLSRKALQSTAASNERALRAQLITEVLRANSEADPNANVALASLAWAVSQKYAPNTLEAVARISGNMAAFHNAWLAKSPHVFASVDYFGARRGMPPRKIALYTSKADTGLIINMQKLLEPAIPLSHTHSAAFRFGSHVTCHGMDSTHGYQPLSIVMPKGFSMHITSFDVEQEGRGPAHDQHGVLMIPGASQQHALVGHEALATYLELYDQPRLASLVEASGIKLDLSS
jgi:hypothetical protein